MGNYLLCYKIIAMNWVRIWDGFPSQHMLK